MLRYEQARKTVIDEIEKKRGPRERVSVRVGDALGWVLAQEVKADREYPPFDRSTRDGYAVRATDVATGVKLPCVGEIKAGDAVTERLEGGTCVQIMTGAAVPAGADAVVMIEHTWRESGAGSGQTDVVVFDRLAQAGQNIVRRGSEARAGQAVLNAGQRLGFAELAQAGQVGAAELQCVKKPRVAILSTGDEIVDVAETPGEFQIRNSNSVSLAAQVRLAGGEPVVLGNAPDRVEELAEKIRAGLAEDMLVLSGGVSMGKYDLVEEVLKSLGTNFYFDAVAIRPGKPTVFGMRGDKPVFGLPGNPVSTMVTFTLFVTAAIDLLSGAEAREVPFVEAKLGEALHEKKGLAHFLPGRIAWMNGEPKVKALRWQGSGDIGAVAKANCFVAVGEEQEEIAAGERVRVILRKDVV